VSGVRRRDLLRGGAAAVGAALGTGVARGAPGAPAPVPGAAAPDPDLRIPADVRTDGPFLHGVASFDPTPDGVVLWTRVAGAAGLVEVRWVVARDPDLDQVVATGTTTTGPERDHTVAVDVDRLVPASTYFYRFEVDRGTSPTGRTRTAPAPGAPTPGGRLRIGVVSCASYDEGWFTAYRHLADHDLDLVVHLGDYIYEHARGSAPAGRQADPPHPCRTLADYRRRHAQARADADLQRLHQLHPVAPTWDDHDVAGNAWRDGAGDHDPDEDGPWAVRREAAIRAWYEWLPVRHDDAGRVRRVLRLGDLADLVLVDTRLEGRDEQVGRGDGAAAVLADPGRRLLGADQLAWLADELTASRARWRLLANQVMLAPAHLEVPAVLGGILGRFALVADGRAINPDQWDGYPAERERLLAVLRDRGIGDVVVLTGDLHSSWAAEVPDPADRARRLAVEVVVPAVSSPTFADTLGAVGPLSELGRRVAIGDNPHLRWVDLDHRGYVVLDVADGHVRADWWHLDDVSSPGGDQAHGASWQVRAGTPALEAVDGPMGPRPASPTAPAPAAPPLPSDAGGDGWPWGLTGTIAAGTLGAVAWVRRRVRRRPASQDEVEV
jgi:phosphodiesterase/alkaline phosphatase D-like protein